MLKLSHAAKGAGNSYLNKTYTMIILAIALAYSVFSLGFGTHRQEFLGLAKKQLDYIFAIVTIGLCIVFM